MLSLSLSSLERGKKRRERAKLRERVHRNLGQKPYAKSSMLYASDPGH
jgi:hypothetical protein